MSSRKNKRQLFAVWLVVLVSVFAGCKKDHTQHPDPGPRTKKLVRIQEGPTDYTAFEYNALGQLIKVKARFLFETGEDVFEYDISYNNDGQIVQASSSHGNIIRYFYKDGKVEKTETSRLATGELIYINTFYYQGDRLVKHGLLSRVDNGSGQVITYKLVQETNFKYFVDGNLQEWEMYGRNSQTDQFRLLQTKKFEDYDNKINPYTSLGDFAIAFYHHVNSRNSLTEYLYDKNGNLQETAENSYNYDNAGYPVKLVQKITPAGSEYPSTTNIIYTYQ